MENISSKNKNLTMMAMLGALSVVLGYYSIVIGDYIKISFSGLPNQIAGHLFGPAAAALFGAVTDLVKYVVKPTGPFFPGFTISAALSGLLYGMAFYQKNITFFRVFLTKLFVVLLVDLLLNTYWLSILYGNGFFAILPVRILKNAIMLPIDSILLYLVMTRMKWVWNQFIR